VSWQAGDLGINGVLELHGIDRYTSVRRNNQALGAGEFQYDAPTHGDDHPLRGATSCRFAADLIPSHKIGAWKTNAISYRVAIFSRSTRRFTPSTKPISSRWRTTAAGCAFTKPRIFLLWQGEPHRAHVFVIQQGTVSLWDEANGRSVLRDILGGGDMLGTERFNGVRNARTRPGRRATSSSTPSRPKTLPACSRSIHMRCSNVEANGGVTSGYNPQARAGNLTSCSFTTS
jgi:hypothetical protein